MVTRVWGVDTASYAEYDDVGGALDDLGFVLFVVVVLEDFPEAEEREGVAATLDCLGMTVFGSNCPSRSCTSPPSASPSSKKSGFIWISKSQPESFADEPPSVKRSYVTIKQWHGIAGMS